jgi:HAD superfamily hydrolase (TIGR01509 family)
VRSHFETVVCGNHVTRLKPAPDPYLLAASRLGVERALVIEDSEAGATSGREAGFEVLRVPSQDRMVSLLRQRLGI